MKENYDVFLCNTTALAKQHGIYYSPGGGPFFATRRAGVDQECNEDHAWAIQVPLDNDGMLRGIFAKDLSMVLALDLADRLNQACRLWADIFRKDERCATDAT